jgi:NAD(P)-dependent dehydrogenase (short-subunit alcohol dehydrogenase family)
VVACFEKGKQPSQVTRISENRVFCGPSLNPEMANKFAQMRKGAYFTIQKALPLLNDGASIILNTSVAGQTDTAGTSAYSATKAALRSVERTTAAELTGRGIRVNTVAPGPIVTPIIGRTGLPKEAIDEFSKEIMAQVPMKRFGQPEEVAGAVAFLASQDASYITSQAWKSTSMAGWGKSESVRYGWPRSEDVRPFVRSEVKVFGEAGLVPNK